jgi:hypothetical protein
MKHKTWFRLVLKAIGVLFIGLSIEPLTWAIGSIIDWGFDVSTAIGWTVSSALAGVTLCSLGLYLFFGGEWIVNKAIPSNRPYCPECGYDLSKSKGGRCAECGTALPGELFGK